MEKELLEKQILKISQFVKMKDFNVAERESRKILVSLNKNDRYEYQSYVKLTNLLIDILLHISKGITALEELDKAVKLFPYEEKFLNKMYQVSLKAKRLQSAEDALKSLINLNPSNLGLRLQLVKLFIEKKDNINAIIELNRIINLDIPNAYVYKLLLSLLAKEKLFTEHLRHTRLMQELFPDDNSLIIEEVRALSGLGKNTEAFEIIFNFFKYKLENALVDQEFYLSLLEFSGLFIKTGNRDLLLEIYIEALSGGFEKLDKSIKISLEKFSKEMNLEIIFNMLCNPKIPPETEFYSRLIKSGKISMYDIIEGIILISQNSDKDSQFFINYLKKTDLPKIVPKEIVPFLNSLINFDEKQI